MPIHTVPVTHTVQLYPKRKQFLLDYRHVLVYFGLLTRRTSLRTTHVRVTHCFYGLELFFLCGAA